VSCQIDAIGHFAPFDAPGTFAKVITDSITVA
jgi:hypothetical protein